MTWSNSSPFANLSVMSTTPDGGSSSPSSIKATLERFDLFKMWAAFGDIGISEALEMREAPEVSGVFGEFRSREAPAEHEQREAFGASKAFKGSGASGASETSDYAF